MSRLVLGIDGGGTKTLAALADEQGRVLGEGRAGTTNHDDVDEATVAAHLQEAVAAARREAGIGNASVAAAFLGLGGVVSERDQIHIRRILERTELVRIPDVLVDHDIRIALAGGLSGRAGIALIVGTGSACYGRLNDGTSWRAGGWGPLLADEGSGYWLGHQALMAGVQMHDGRLTPTPLEARMLDLLGVTSPDDLMHRVYVEGLTRAQIAAFGPAVLELALDGDAVAGDIVERGTFQLARCVSAVATRLGLDAERFEITYAGSLIERSVEIRSRLAAHLSRQVPTGELVAPELSPVRGACLLALHRIGVRGPGVRERLAR